jgi:hypothetical protein
MQSGVTVNRRNMRKRIWGLLAAAALMLPGLGAAVAVKTVPAGPAQATHISSCSIEWCNPIAH